VRSLHDQLGIALLLLLALRLPWRWSHPVSRIETPAPAWTQTPALLAKIALYALMFALPLLGIGAIQAHGESVIFLGVTLPDLFKSFASRQRKAARPE
jgi:cytochrome b561